MNAYICHLSDTRMSPLREQVRTSRFRTRLLPDPTYVSRPLRERKDAARGSVHHDASASKPSQPLPSSNRLDKIMDVLTVPPYLRLRPGEPPPIYCPHCSLHHI